MSDEAEQNVELPTAETASAAEAPPVQETTLGGIRETLKQEFKSLGGKLDKLLKSSKAIERGLADPDELKDRLARLTSYARQKQVLDVLEKLNEHQTWSVAFAARQLHTTAPHGFPTPEALTTACYRVNILKFRSGPE